VQVIGQEDNGLDGPRMIASCALDGVAKQAPSRRNRENPPTVMRYECEEVETPLSLPAVVRHVDSVGERPFRVQQVARPTSDPGSEPVDLGTPGSMAGAGPVGTGSVGGLSS